MPETHVVLGLGDDLLALHAGDPHDLTLSDAVVFAERRRRLGQPGRKTPARRGLVDDQELLIRQETLHFILVADDLRGLPSRGFEALVFGAIAIHEMRDARGLYLLPLW